MRPVRYHEFGGPEKLQIEQVPQPELDGENVLIQITRTGVSPLDDKVRRGVLPPTMSESSAALSYEVFVPAVDEENFDGPRDPSLAVIQGSLASYQRVALL